MNKKLLVDSINDKLNEVDNLSTYRKYVTMSGKNVKFLLKVIDKIKYPDLYDLLVKINKM